MLKRCNLKSLAAQSVENIFMPVLRHCKIIRNTLLHPKAISRRKSAKKAPLFNCCMRRCMKYKMQTFRSLTLSKRWHQNCKLNWAHQLLEQLQWNTKFWSVAKLSWTCFAFAWPVMGNWGVCLYGTNKWLNRHHQLRHNIRPRGHTMHFNLQCVLHLLC